MAQVINSSEELLDGAQIAFKMVSALKGGQSPFASNDLRCYDLGQIKTKYYTALSDTYSAAPDNRLPAHSGYFPIVYFKYGTTDAIAHQATLSSYVFKDNSFDGTADSYVAIGDTLYSAYGSPGSNTPAPAGYYMRGDNFYWYISGTAGVIASSGTYVPPGLDTPTPTPLPTATPTPTPVPPTATPTPTPVPTATPTPTPGENPRTQVTYYGYGSSEMEAWDNGSANGFLPNYIYQDTVTYLYYSDPTGGPLAASGVYLVMVGTDYIDSAYIYV